MSEENDFLKQKVNYALVLNTDLETIDQLRHFLADREARVIYQRTSLSKLMIKEENSS